MATTAVEGNDDNVEGSSKAERGGGINKQRNEQEQW